eukprot:6188031-Pleurochrysis_carterae.AAC.3
MNAELADSQERQLSGAENTDDRVQKSHNKRQHHKQRPVVSLPALEVNILPEMARPQVTKCSQLATSKYDWQHSWRSAYMAGSQEITSSQRAFAETLAAQPPTPSLKHRRSRSTPATRTHAQREAMGSMRSSDGSAHSAALPSLCHTP